MKTQEQRARERAFRAHHQIGATVIKRSHVLQFLSKWYSVHCEMYLDAWYNNALKYPCVVHCELVDCEGNVWIEEYVGRSWVDVMMQIDTSFSQPFPETGDDIPF